MKHKKKEMVNEIYWGDNRLEYITLLKVKSMEAMKKKEDEEESIPLVNKKKERYHKVGHQIDPKTPTIVKEKTWNFLNSKLLV